MKTSELQPSALEPAELEPAELEPAELQPLETEEPSAASIGLAQRASRVARKSPLLSNIHIQGLIGSYQVSPEPAGILDENLSFIYRNQALKRLLKIGRAHV